MNKTKGEALIEGLVWSTLLLIIADHAWKNYQDYDSKWKKMSMQTLVYLKDKSHKISRIK